ncbi:RDD family protein [Nostoc sp. 'Lobaria pulmonaria (5183) cyanobiont']|uniref:RDD family protein n=1 Tax=Nostoc sp. 'Lobaria pulmonaria (5183) cyanobiont' TaxID=1618022 RepID=UPI000CF309FC|nr:RDD family protein [Nostoc sp. 'Lobaria pulmonaria (5183) cyanobiont']AVH69954.1 RDD domain-containing protein [Nostoc sp. 'Lobaria pulmonaria (5183) cyanobiont']
MRFFNRITFQTPESVELEFTLAGIGNRALALLIDYTVLGITLLLFVLTWSVFSTQLLNFVEYFFTNLPSLDIWLLAIFFIIAFAIYIGYFVFFETLWFGQTPGKRVAKIRVVRDDGRLIGLQQATLRALLRPFDETLFIGAFLIMLGSREKRLGDLAAGTIVIQAQTPTASAKLTISEQAKGLHEQLIEIADFSQLMPDDFAVIREYLQRRAAMSLKARASLSLKLAEQVKAIIHLEKLPEAVTPDVFLEAIYLGYQQPEF